MSALSIKAAIETALGTINPVISTAWENTVFTPVVNVPYQYVRFIGFIPDTAEVTKSHRLCGYCQIELYYPLGVGSNAVMTRAELVKSRFKKGSAFLAGSVITTITNTPEILPGTNEGDRWKVIVKVDYSAWIIVS